jgi:hydroxypyruvate isomerase
MEITNSKVAADQRTDQVFDHLAWGFDVCKRVNSPRVKVLFDIYHVQIMDGDVTRHLRENINSICHIHVAGVPTRQEIDDTQELNYRFIASAIADLGFTGFVAHGVSSGTGTRSDQEGRRSHCECVGGTL